ncbi:hypothetical protein H0H87_004258 [Tephrocybe sp. NHM501043]|nr:hypothetical protein H0H87_004258 [Tephrocybe sp. NHM501043]
MATNADDVPVLGTALTVLEGPLKLPAIVFGAGTFGNQYNSDAHLQSTFPVRTVGLALRYDLMGVSGSFYSDSSPMTKCGRFGPSDFDYSPSRIRDSVKRSLDRLQTDYLDTVYLHDVEFVCTPVAPRTNGSNLGALANEAAEYGLALGDEKQVRGEGDQKVLDAYAELRKLQEEGLVKNIGITGKTFLRYAPLLRERAKVGQLLAASPFSMGLLTPSPPPWHPAPAELFTMSREAAGIWSEGLPNLALGYAIRNTGSKHGHTPLVAGFSTPDEVHECIRVWRELQDGESDGRKKAEEDAQGKFAKAGYLDWSWASP